MADNEISGVDAESGAFARIAADDLRNLGYCILENVIPGDLTEKLHTEFHELYRNYLQESEKDDALTVGNKRYLVSVEMSGAFADPRLYANPAVISVLSEALGPDMILEAFGVVVSLPGAASQKMHRDGPPLFPGPLVGMVPTYAVTVGFPLVEMNNVNGTTALWPETHRYKSENEFMVPYSPVVQVGSVAMWDFRLAHGGTANRSDIPRPLIYCTYSRKWFRDFDNFVGRKQRRIICPPEFLSQVPEPHKHLFAHLAE